MRFLALLLAGPAAILSAQPLTPAWVEIGPEGAAIARVIVTSADDCPSLVTDGAPLRMSLRQPVPQGLRPVCEATIPATVKSASLNGQALMLPAADPSHIVVIGDTGCRIKGERVQNCNDPAQWPFETISGRASAEKPQLVIHVGDYLYREQKCPTPEFCGGSPSGDIWEAWNADFFQPAAKLLAAAPWIFVRGNHESCGRSWRGWFYYLDPRPFTGTCEDYSPPYVARLGRFEVAVLDTASASDTPDAKQTGAYAAQIASLRVRHAWLVDHHPFWGMKTDMGATQPTPLPTPLGAAWDQAAPKGIDLILSGHTHLFEILSFEHGRPPQVVAGDGGTDMALAIPVSVKGMTIRGVTIAAGETRHEFGYTVLNKVHKGWKLELKNPSSRTLVTCRIEGERVIF